MYSIEKSRISWVAFVRDVDAASYQEHLISEESGTTFPS